MQSQRTQRPIIWSYTFLSDYENCPRKAFHKFVARDLPEEEKTQAQRDGIAVHDQFVNRIIDDIPWADEKFQKYETFAQGIMRRPEQKFCELKLGITAAGTSCHFFDDAVWGRSALDVVLLKHDAAVMFDWKNGKVRENPFEFKIHAVLLQAKFPAIKTFVGRYVWLGEMRVGTPHNVSDTLATWNDICERMRAVEHYAAHAHWPPRENPLCAWCPVKSCEFNKNR